MSSSGECELDSEATPAATISLPTASATNPKMAEPSGKKTVYTRKKSTSAMQRKISAELSLKSAPPATTTVTLGVDESEKDTGEDSDGGPGGASSKGFSSEKYLSPRLAPHSHPSKPHYHRHHSASNSLRKHVLVRRSPSPSASMSPGYEQYQMTLLEVPLPRDYGEASSDDLSSEWDSDAPDSRSRFLGNFKVIRDLFIYCGSSEQFPS